MTKNPFVTPEHNFPIMNVGISASQNVYGSQAITDKKEASSYAYYLTHSKMASLKFKRTADMVSKGYDENKAMFPIYKGVPLFVIPTIAMLEAGRTVHVLGSHEVGYMVKALAAYYSSLSQDMPDMPDKPDIDISTRLQWVPELEELTDLSMNPYVLISERRKFLKLNNSIAKLAKSFELDGSGGKDGGRDCWAFMAGDIIAYNPSFCYDRDIISHCMVADLNGLETIRPPVPRNYYHALQDGNGVVHVKEPNVWLLGPEIKADDSEGLYNRRMKGDFGILHILGLTSKNMLKHWDWVTINNLYTLNNAMFMEARCALSKKFSKRQIIPSYPAAELESLCKFVYLSPIRIKSEHTDWLRLKDVDALHDYVFVRALLETNIDNVLPSNLVKRIEGFADYIKQNRTADTIPILRDFTTFLNEKAARVESDRKLRRLHVNIPKPFANGDLRYIFGPGESIEQVLERTKADLEAFHRLDM